MAHSIETRINPAGFQEVYCSDGHYITTWQEGDDILEFSSFQIAYTKLDADTSIFHCITAEENERLEALRLEAEEEKRKQEELDKITE